MAELTNPPDAEEFVAQHYGSRASQLELLGAGEWSRAYSFKLDDQESVIRFGNHGEDFAKDQVMSRFSSAELPIPKVLELGDTSSGFFVVSERAYGAFLDELDGDGMRAVLPCLFRTLDAISAIDIATNEGYGIWSPQQRGEHSTWQTALLDVARDRPRIPGWRAVLESSPTGTERFDEAYEVLSQLVATLPNERQLIHDDLLYRNVLVEGNRINAVIDWGNSMYGDHLYEAALLLYWWPWYPQWSGIDIRAELDRHWAELGGAPPADLEQRLLAYQIHTGLEHQVYSAFKGYWDDLERNAQQTIVLAEMAQGSNR